MGRFRISKGEQQPLGAVKHSTQIQKEIYACPALVEFELDLPASLQMKHPLQYP